MRILHVHLSHLSLPPTKYGGTERVIWALYRGQHAMGHQIRFLWKQNSSMPAETQVYDPSVSMEEQIGTWPDVVHFHWPFEGALNKPFVCTEHGNANLPRDYPLNTVFLSRKHAENHGASYWIYNGLDWSDYGEPDLGNSKAYCHFLGKAKAKVKNLQGAVEIARRANRSLHVLGGHRITLRRNPYICFNPKVHFHGMVGGHKKNALIRGSAALIAPARWHEPFGLAIIESLYLGTPVIATAYGALPELIPDPAMGILSNRYDTLAAAASDTSKFDRKACHNWAKTRFDMLTMARHYQSAYERVIEGETLNSIPPKTGQGHIDLLPVEE
ncbi:MAG: glycosyltransferase [Halieaceae bacterium]|jgi:glycosyltransferase involved in cell wall biosynthesis|nr:glycosyltransferase [Halieaceae bacterium]